MRTKLRYFCAAEKIGPGAMLMPSLRARRASSRLSTCGASSTQMTKPPAGWVMRVPGGKWRVTASITRQMFAAAYERENGE